MYFGKNPARGVLFFFYCIAFSFKSGLPRRTQYASRSPSLNPGDFSYPVHERRTGARRAFPARGEVPCGIVSFVRKANVNAARSVLKRAANRLYYSASPFSMAKTSRVVSSSFGRAFGYLSSSSSMNLPFMVEESESPIFSARKSPHTPPGI